MRFTDIVYRKADGIAWLMINRPEVYHAVRGKTPTPAHRYDPDYQKRDEAEEHRLAFLQRCKPDPAKNLPYLELQS